MFKETFKYYKSRIPKPDFKDVVDFDVPAVFETKYRELELPNIALERLPPGIKPIHKWKCYQLMDHAGLIVIRCPFTTQAQRYWIARCLRDIPRHPNVNNLNERLFQPQVLADWWKELNDCTDENEARRIKISMRWTTLGYHHNWDTKVYNEQMKNTFPADLAELSKFFSTVLGFENFRAQAAIVNYYPIGTTLAGHTDHSEQDLNAPLFSFSFGQTAIFLIGGQTKDEKPTALFLKSGDVLVMSRESRICYHAVPRVMKATEETWNFAIDHEKYEHDNEITPTPKRLKADIDYLLEQNGHNIDSTYDKLLYEKICQETFWLKFRNYLNDARININVRQVLQPGLTSL